MSLPTQARIVIVIVGGGIAGCSTAYHLSLQGERDGLLLDQGKLACGPQSVSSGPARSWVTCSHPASSHRGGVSHCHAPDAADRPQRQAGVSHLLCQHRLDRPDAGRGPAVAPQFERSPGAARGLI